MGMEEQSVDDQHAWLASLDLRRRRSMRISGLQASNPHHGRMGIEQSETAMWPGCMELLMPRPPEYLSALPAGTAAIINLTPHTRPSPSASMCPRIPRGARPSHKARRGISGARRPAGVAIPRRSPTPTMPCVPVLQRRNRTTGRGVES